MTVHRKGGRRGLLVLIVIAAMALGSFWYLRRGAEQAAVGDCMALDQGADVPFRVVDCDDPAAAYTVLTVITDQNQECKNVAGASQSSSSAQGTVCMGDKGVDPATAINVAKEGDCLTVNGDKAQRLDCTSPQARDKVLRRLTDVATYSLSTACADVSGSTAYYAWIWQSIGRKVTTTSLSVDVLLCLGPR